MAKQVRRPTALRLKAVGILVGIVLPLVLTVPGAAARTPFEARAGADLFRLLVRLEPAVLQEDLLDPGAVSAQASLTSFGESVAFGSYPYPGSLPVAAQGLANGVLSQTKAIPPELASLVRVPDIPLVASSSFPASPDVETAVGPISMRASSREAESSAVATDGLDQGEANVRYDELSDIVTAHSTISLGRVALAPTFVVHGLRSEATATRGPDGTVALESSLGVTIEVLGVRLRLDGTGVHLADTTLPVGGDAALDLVDGLLSALAGAGTTVEVLPEVRTATSVTSSAVHIQEQLATDADGGRVTVSIVLGRTFASITGGSEAAAAEPPASGIALGGGPSASGGGSPLSLPPTEASSPVDAEAPLVPAVAARGLRAERVDAPLLFPVLVLAGAALLLSSTAFRKLGAATPWSS